MKKNNSLIAAIDLGNYSIKLLVAEKENQDIVRIVDTMTFKTQGLSHGKIISLDVFDNLIKSISQYLIKKKIKLNQIILGLNGDYFQAYNYSSVIRFNKSNHVIDFNDIKRLKSEIKKNRLKPNQEVLQVFDSTYILDGQKGIVDPIGLMALNLQINSYLVVSSISITEQIRNVFSRYNLAPQKTVLSSYAASLICLNVKQKNFGSLILDIGFQNTNLIIYNEGRPVLLKIFPIGSQHITNDLALGLKIDLDLAEHIKVDFLEINKKNNHQLFFKNSKNQTVRFNSNDIRLIITARLNDLVDLIQQSIESINKIDCLPGGLVLIGNGSKMVGLDDYLAHQLGLSCYRAETEIFDLNKNLHDIGLAGVVGLAQLDKFYDNDFDFVKLKLNKKRPLKIFKSLWPY